MKDFSTYRKTMAEAYSEVPNILESTLMGVLSDKQIQNLKDTWATKSLKDVTPGVTAILKKMNMPTKVAIAAAKINVLKDIVFKEESDEEVIKFMEAIDEQADIEEGRIKDIFTANQEGDSIEKIAKRLKLSVKTVRDILGEEVLEDILYEVADSITPMMLKVLKKEYEPFRGRKISAARAKQLMNILDKFNDKNLEILKKHNIPFVSSGAMSKLMVRKMKWKTTSVNPFKEEDDINWAGKLEEKKKVKELDLHLKTLSKSDQKLPEPEGKKIATEELEEQTPDPTQYGPDKVAKAMKIAVKSDGNYSGAVREIEKIARNLSKVSTIAKALKTANESIEEIWGARKASGGYHGDKKFKKLKSELEPKGKELEEKDGANTSSKKGSVWRKAMKAAMKRNYMRKAEHEPKGDELKEKFTVQITKTDGSKLVIGKYNTPAEAEKYIRWYKTGSMSHTKSVKVIKEMAKDDAYAIGMAAAKKHTGDTKAPLEKSTVKKGHEIADKILNKEGKSDFRISYSDKYGKHAGFEDGETLQDIQNKAQKLRAKGFKIDKMGRNTSPIKERLWLKHKRGDKS
jgi:hypothetical protein